MFPHLRDPDPPAATAIQRQAVYRRADAHRRRRRIIIGGAAGVILVGVGFGIASLDGGDGTTIVVQPTPPTTVLPNLALPAPDTGVRCHPSQVDISRLELAQAPTLGPVEPAPPGANGVGPFAQYVAHWRQGDQAVELHLPMTVVTDLVGERIEPVTVNDQEAVLWYHPQGWAQVRANWGPEAPSWCRGFDVTVYGADQEANARLAMDIARRLRFKPAGEPARAVAAYYDAILTGDRNAALALVADEAETAFAPSLDELLSAQPGFVVQVEHAAEQGGPLVGVVVWTLPESPLRFTPRCRFYVSTTQKAGSTLLDGMTSCTAP